jgi:hypothetical protein
VEISAFIQGVETAVQAVSDDYVGKATRSGLTSPRPAEPATEAAARA